MNYDDIDTISTQQIGINGYRKWKGNDIKGKWSYLCCADKKIFSLIYLINTPTNAHIFI